MDFSDIDMLCHKMYWTEDVNGIYILNQGMIKIMNVKQEAHD